MAKFEKSSCRTCGVVVQPHQVQCANCASRSEETTPSVAEETAPPVEFAPPPVGHSPFTPPPGPPAPQEQWQPPQQHPQEPPLQQPQQFVPQFQAPPVTPMPYGAAPTSRRVPVGLVVGLALAAVLMIGAVAVGVWFVFGDSSGTTANGTDRRSGSGGTGSSATQPSPEVVWQADFADVGWQKNAVMVDGDLLLVHEDGTTTVRNVSDNEVLHTLQGEVLGARDGLALLEAPDTDDPVVTVVSAEDGEEVWSHEVDGYGLESATLTEHGVLWSSYMRMGLLDFATGAERWADDFGFVLTASRSGDVVATMSGDVVRAVDVASGDALVSVELAGRDLPASLVTDEVLVLTWGEESRAWDLDTGDELWHEEFDLDGGLSTVLAYELPGGSVVLMGLGDGGSESEFRVLDADGRRGDYPYAYGPDSVFEAGGEEFALLGDGTVLDGDLEVVAEPDGIGVAVPGGVLVHRLFGRTGFEFVPLDGEAGWKGNLGIDSSEVGMLTETYAVDDGLLLRFDTHVVLLK